jgi:hypothetical protein
MTLVKFYLMLTVFVEYNGHMLSYAKPSHENLANRILYILLINKTIIS